MILFLIACQSPLLLEGVGTTNKDGLLDVQIPVSTEDAFMVMAKSEHLLVLKELYSPEGTLVLSRDDWKDSDMSLSAAMILSNSDLAFSWPIRSEDIPLSQGDWRVRLACYDAQGYPSPDTDITVQSQLKEDPDFSLGTLKVRILSSDLVGPDVQESIELAVQGWIDMWADFGITLSIRYDVGFSEPLPPVYLGDDRIESVHAESEEGELLIIVGETIQDAEGVLGFAGSVPGSYFPSPRSAVVISWLTNAGSDGIFSQAELQLFSETLAHEAGHYLGLFHPVEIDYDRWDALADTEDCIDQSSCHATLQNNLMFPYPVCSSSGCVQQNELSADQISVLHRYIGVQ